MRPHRAPLNENEKEELRDILERETNEGNSIGPTRAARDLKRSGGRGLEPYMVRDYYNTLVKDGIVAMNSDVPERPKYSWVGESD